MRFDLDSMTQTEDFGSLPDDLAALETPDAKQNNKRPRVRRSPKVGKGVAARIARGANRLALKLHQLVGSPGKADRQEWPQTVVDTTPQAGPSTLAALSAGATSPETGPPSSQPPPKRRTRQHVAAAAKDIGRKQPAFQAAFDVLELRAEQSAEGVHHNRTPEAPSSPSGQSTGDVFHMPALSYGEASTSAEAVPASVGARTAAETAATQPFAGLYATKSAVSEALVSCLAKFQHSAVRSPGGDVQPRPYHELPQDKQDRLRRAVVATAAGSDQDADLVEFLLHAALDRHLLNLRQRADFFCQLVKHMKPKDLRLAVRRSGTACIENKKWPLSKGHLPGLFDYLPLPRLQLSIDKTLQLLHRLRYNCSDDEWTAWQELLRIGFPMLGKRPIHSAATLQSLCASHTELTRNCDFVLARLGAQCLQHTQCTLCSCISVHRHEQVVQLCLHSNKWRVVMQCAGGHGER